MVFNESCNAELSEAWVEQFLIKELKQGQVVIMDNASFHKSNHKSKKSIKKTRELVESVNCSIIFYLLIIHLILPYRKILG